MKSRNSKKRRATGLAWAMVILVLAIAIPLNLIANRLDLSWDMTPSRLYSLSETSTDYLEELSESDTKVNMYFLMKMDELETDDDSMALYNILKQYSRYSCINFVDFDPDEDPELVDSLNPDGYLNLTTGDILIECGGVEKRIPGTSMYKYEGNYNSNGTFVTEAAYFQGENYITGAIKAAVSNITPVVYFLSGHGEPSLEDNYTSLIANLSNYNYDAKQINLMEEGKIPDDAAILFEAGPTEDITDDEKEMIDEYLDGGGNITFMMTPEKADMRYKNIEAIMDDFCIAMDYDRVYETDNDYHVSGDAYTVQCNLVESDSSDDSDSSDSYIDITAVNDASSNTVDLTSGLIDSGIYTFMPESRSFYTASNENYSSLTMGDLIRTNTSAVGEPYGGTDDDPANITDDVNGLTLSMYSMDETRNSAKVVVFGSAEFINDERLKDDYFVNPVYLLLSTISWMKSSDVDMGIEDKENVYDTIDFVEQSRATSTIWVFLAVPVVIAVAGLCIWAGRRKA